MQEHEGIASAQVGVRPALQCKQSASGSSEPDEPVLIRLQYLVTVT